MPKTSVFRTRVGSELMMGKIVQLSNIGIDRIPCAQVRCSLNEFNVYLKKYFARSFDFWALDKSALGGLGDTVLIKRIDGHLRPTANVAHSIDKVVFQYGNIIDPVTGKRVINDEFADEVELKKKLVGEVVDQPFQEDSLLFDERRSMQIKTLEQKKSDLSS